MSVAHQDVLLSRQNMNGGKRIWLCLSAVNTVRLGMGLPGLRFPHTVRFGMTRGGPLSSGRTRVGCLSQLADGVSYFRRPTLVSSDNKIK